MAQALVEFCATGNLRYEKMTYEFRSFVAINLHNMSAHARLDGIGE